ncbi:hypothetical protein M9H77_04301 [Catharanthus roseus]|uniref:Uncharacterized protein n=1 Tax=Catharanthus roseus TaxID=4058 RepID=A0ACC0CE47_CATRO|nr:hypothetical protein M9H77_04301 [Catharanthus roseus]
MKAHDMKTTKDHSTNFRGATSFMFFSGVLEIIKSSIEVLHQGGLNTFKLSMEEDLRHVQQALEELEQQLSCLAKGVKDLRREEEAILEQSSRRNLGGHPMHNKQWGYGNFSPHARSYEHNSYDYYEGNRLGARNCYNDTSCKRVPRNEVRNKGNYVNGGFHKREIIMRVTMIVIIMEGIRRSSRTLGTTSRPLSYNNLKFPLLWDTFGSYEHVAWEKKVELLFYSMKENGSSTNQGLELNEASIEDQIWSSKPWRTKTRLSEGKIQEIFNG